MKIRMLKRIVLFYSCMLNFSCFADGVGFSIEQFAFELTLEQREQAIANENFKQLTILQSITPTSRSAYFLKQSESDKNLTAPDAFYLFYEDCQSVSFCSYFKSELAKRLTQHFRIADQISLNKLSDRAVLCDLDILKECHSGADEASSIELLPQLVVKLMSWQHHDKQYAGYEAHVALLEFGEILWLENFYIPYASPRPSLKKLASNISFEMADK
jgi:hypothetical protein